MDCAATVIFRDRSIGAIPATMGAVVPTVWTVSDETLVAGLAAGDHDAASAFVQRFQRRGQWASPPVRVWDRAGYVIRPQGVVPARAEGRACTPPPGRVPGGVLPPTPETA